MLVNIFNIVFYCSIQPNNSATTRLTAAVVVTFTFFHVVPQDADVQVPVGPRLFVVEAERVHKLVDDDGSRIAAVAEGKLFPK